MITPDKLRALGIRAAQAQAFAAPLSAACQRYGITTPRQLAAFVGQLRVESADFRVLRENLNYTTPSRIASIFKSRTRMRRPGEQPGIIFGADGKGIAEELAGKPELLARVVYAGRLGNGDFASGDGARFIGRGLKQLTGRDNYTRAAAAIGRPYVEQPELVERPEDACLTAAWFWADNKLGPVADAWDLRAVTRVVNGPGMLGAAERAQFAEAALRVLA